MAENCVFCAIVAGDVPSTKIYEDEHTYAFADLDPQAPLHVLIVPRRHFSDIAELGQDAAAAGALLAGIRGLAEQEGLSNFRTVFNTGAESGQSVFHVHAHVLSGRRMTWPPG